MPPITRIDRSEFSNHPLLARLLELHDIPEELYLCGELPEVTLDTYGRATPRILTVVGSRKYTEYGRRALQKLVRELAGYPVIILSGLALGIDGIAHSEALKNNLTTLAIPGSGLDPSVIYPRTHKHLAEDILVAHGALISELPPRGKSAPWTFPARNRIMSALSDAVLIVEAGAKSGTLITARQSLELGRDIGAIPGDIFRETSQGSNKLIHDGAYSIATGDDLLDLLHLSKKTDTATLFETPLHPMHHFSPSEKIILELLHNPQEKDSLLISSKLPLTDFLAAFSTLEIQGAITETFGEVRKMV
jgi:DNA processing protein